ncbi:MAG: 50S ribosomal protein L11 methyltransferase [Oligoflexia bacterium]|nr:50S ribosomal protein L11 methyltransferase [Oligoflexia bacterium]
MSGSATYRFWAGLPRWIALPEVSGRPVDRDAFYEWAWKALARHGLLGIHEGTVLSAEAAEQGLETESWTLDAAEAPRERDWIGHQSKLRAEFYFETREGAGAAAKRLGELAGLEISETEEVPAQDWDAQWKAAFLSSPDGVRIPPDWRVIPPWVTAEKVGDERVLRINPGAGFGTGTHETTQLCLGAIAEFAGAGRTLAGRRVLDFGSGSGILAIGAALVGGSVDAVEIDPLAIDNAVENARLNDVEARITYSRELAARSPLPSYDLVIANILRPVLLEFASELVARLRPGGGLVLSGLIEGDVAEVAAKFGALMGGEPRKSALNEWRGLYWPAKAAMKG